MDPRVTADADESGAEDFVVLRVGVGLGDGTAPTVGTSEGVGTAEGVGMTVGRAVATGPGAVVGATADGAEVPSVGVAGAVVVGGLAGAVVPGVGAGTSVAATTDPGNSRSDATRVAMPTTEPSTCPRCAFRNRRGEEDSEGGMTTSGRVQLSGKG
jgi:hypothetical protein